MEDINLAAMYLKKNLPDKAIEILKSSSLQDDKTYNNIAYIFNRQFRFTEALEWSDKAYELDENNAETNYNRGIVLANLRRYQEAIESYSKCSYAIARYNKGYCLAITGKLEEAWQEMSYKTAFEFVKQFKKRFSAPDWDGSHVDSLLVYSEQGIGDAIQFSRYLPMIQANNIILEVQREAIKLFKIKVEQVFGRTGFEKNDLPHYDAVVSISDLPMIFKTTLDTIPRTGLNLPKNEKYDKFFCNDKKKIGICWAGSSTHHNDYFRSMPCINFKKLERDDIQLYSLQKESGKRWFGNLDSDKVNYIDLAIHTYDFLETAQLINKLDLIVTADTAIAHLAGTLNKPVYVLLPYLCDWRWLLDRTDSPWYPSMKLFRQSEFGIWDDVFEQVALNI